MTAVTEQAVVIRDIDSIAEVHAVEELQKEIWGIPDVEVVPLSQLVAAKNSGGVLIGAFDRGELVGFAYGFVGLERGVSVHHSHMLAVRPAYRSHDLGFRLKAEQREQVMAQGIGLMTWTFDPLQSLNAYFNINKLGVVADRYYVNLYGGDAASFLHRNGTDRLWVTWLLDSGRVVERLDRSVPVEEPVEIAKLVEVGADDRPRLNDLDRGLSGGMASIEIPADINALERRDGSLASEWREATRRAFTTALDAGFIVEEFYRGLRSGRPFGTYVLKRGRI
jgi:predicted GNAT superfamily acetyltransferase